MLHARGFSKSCTLLAVLCGKLLDTEDNDRENKSHRASYPFPSLASSGRLEVHTLINPSIDRLREVLKSVEPNFLYFQGMLLENEERIGSVAWAGIDLSDPTTFSMLIGPPLPTTVYLEFPRSEKVAEALHSQGIPYVIYWRNELSSYMASHFRQALLSVIQSSCSHTWDAFHLAHASFRLYCLQSNIALAVNNQKINSKLGPCILGDAPKFNIPIPGKDPGGKVEEEEEPFDNIPTIKIYDNNVDLKFLICGLPCTLDVCLLSTLKDGLNALLNVEIRGSKLHNRVSATPPSVQAGTISRGVITMRCDLTTCSSTHISLLVSGSAHTCFNDQLLENHIKKELIENSQLVHLPSDYEEKHQNFTVPRKSSSIACGSSVFEVCMKVPTWASQVLKQLAPQICYRSLVSLGVASVQGSPVASFEKDDSSRLLFFFSRQGDRFIQDGIAHNSPIWLKPPTPSRKRSMSYRERTNSYGMLDENAQDFVAGSGSPVEPTKRRAKFATMKPIPHVRQHKMLTFSEMYDSGGYDVNRAKTNLAVIPCTRHIPPAPVTHKKAASNCFQPQQIISLNPLPLKKHGCNRTPIQTCPEEEFLRDVMEFLILRGHSRLVPQGGISEFPDAILNAKRLDLYNLYREVVTRGGFHVGNGINWKGQVFSKMRNHTVANRMTGVGNTLKRHYETYLLEYELAHDDVDGECCILCHSSAPGDWVNCGLCGEWAHFGCDRRQGLGAFKDYAKTDGLDYVCPHCSLTNYKKKSPKVANGFPQGRAASRLL